MDKPKLIFLIGTAGAGKSTVGKKLAATLKWCYLDKDVVANRFTGAMLVREGYGAQDRDQCAYYKETIYELEYETLLNLAADNLRLGNSVILDAPFIGYFNDKDYVKRFLEKYDLQDITPLVLNVYVESHILKERIIARNNERDQWKLDNWDEFIQSVKDKKCQWKDIVEIHYNNVNPEIDLTLLCNYILND